MNKFFSIILFVSLLLAGSVIGSAQQKKVCAVCKKVLSGSFIKVDDKYYHANHFLCQFCGKVISGTHAKDNDGYYHPECFAKKNHLVCDHCGQVIAGPYLIFKDKNYHNDCYYNFIVPKCAVCGKPMDGEYFIDQLGYKFHIMHKNQFPECDNCGRLVCDSITHGGVKYDDGRAMCNLCLPRVINKIAEYQDCLELVRETVSDMGIHVPRKSVSIKVVSLQELQKISKNRLNPKGLRGFCESQKNTMSIAGQPVQETTTHTIYVLSGMPRLTTSAVIAHELMHAWIFENAKKKLTPEIVEGSCNYISFLYLYSFKTPESLELITGLEKNPDPIYGGGFIKIRDQFFHRDLENLLEYLR
ncbi:MAG: protein DA1 [Ignavibacteria bacterium]|nr:protein DA1 [Ignavibacteria bacterium]